jgi:hypothetical protein
MAKNLLQSLVQRGAPCFAARVTGLESKGIFQAMEVSPAPLSLLRHPTPGYAWGADPDAERCNMHLTASAVPGAGRSLRLAGVPASIRVARTAIRVVPSGWPVSGATIGKAPLALAGRLWSSTSN